MFTDMVGYTALAQRDESLSLELVNEQRNLIRRHLGQYRGREVKTMGDAFLVEFPNALDAVKCAHEIQKGIRESNNAKPDSKRIHIRIGIHLGDVVETGGDISGDAVNVASRIEPIAEVDGICLSRVVYESVKGKAGPEMESMGARPLKNVNEPMEVFKIVMPWEVEVGSSKLQLDRRRIAVLPFANMSPVPEDAYFADGLTEELISTMSKIGGLKVIARTSVMGYKGGQKKISEIAKELDVGTILEGSVRKAGDRARITVQLIDSGTSEHLWAESYDRELKDVFAIQSDISMTVAEALKVQLSSREKVTVGKEQTSSPEAHTLYLKGRYYLNERTKENSEKALKYFEQAVGVDPAFALAYSGLSDCFNIMADYGWREKNSSIALAKDYSLKALHIDDTLAEAHASLGLTLNAEGSHQFAEMEFSKAIELRPNYPIVYHWYANLLIPLGRAQEAYEKELKGFDLDPYSAAIAMGVGNALYFLSRYEEAIKYYEKVERVSPNFASVHFWSSGSYLMLSRFDEAVREAERAVELDNSPAHQFNLAFTYGAVGKRVAARKVLKEATKSPASGEFPGMHALAYFGLDETDEGFVWIRKALEKRDNSILYFDVDPWFARYRSDSRWKELGEALAKLRTA